MILTSVTAHAVRRHVLDVVSVLAHTGIDLIREAANAPAAGDDWLRVLAHDSRPLSAPLVTEVTVIEPITLDGPLHGHITFAWRRVGASPLRRRGHATLRVTAMALGAAPWTELSVLVATHPRLPGLGEPRWASEMTSRFLSTLARNLEHALPVRTGA